jgi:two-component system, cell cycle sensor histidine kinase and response regulator CckA
VAVSSEAHFSRSLPRRIAIAPPARILIVDDDVAVRDFVDQILRGAGYVTARAVDGRDALEMAARLGPFDLLVTDELMPRMLGHELVQQLRRQQPHLKVLYLTGYSDRLFQEKSIVWECEAFLDKPSTPTLLLETVSLMLTDDRAALDAPRTCRRPRPRLVR